MTIEKLDLNNISDFSELVQPYVLGGFERNEKFGVGVRDDNLPMGILVFSYSEDSDDEKLCAVLDWLYVADDYRRRGVADRIYRIFLDTVKELDARRVICRFLRGYDRDEIRGFLGKYGFTVSEAVSDELLVYHEELYNITAISDKVSADGIMRITDLKKTHEGKLLLCDKKLRKWLMDHPEADKELSIVCSRDGVAIDGVMLVESDSFGTVKVLLARTFAEGRSGAMAMLKMVHYELIEWMYGVYKPVWIRVPVRKDNALELVNYLLPVMPKREIYIGSTGI